MKHREAHSKTGYTVENSLLVPLPNHSQADTVMDGFKKRLVNQGNIEKSNDSGYIRVFQASNELLDHFVTRSWSPCLRLHSTRRVACVLNHRLTIKRSLQTIPLNAGIYTLVFFKLRHCDVVSFA